MKYSPVVIEVICESFQELPPLLSTPKTTPVAASSPSSGDSDWLAPILVLAQTPQC